MEFLKRMTAYVRRMVKYVGDDSEVALGSELEDGERPLVLVVQDESCFASYEGQKMAWMLKDKNILKPKDAGRSLMVSECLCEFYGRLRLTDEQKTLFPDVPSEATMIIKPGNGGDCLLG